MSNWGKAIAIARKDVVSELRTKEIISSVLVFTLLVILIFNFAFGSDLQTLDMVASGMLWVTFAFAGVLSLNRAFVIEMEDGCLQGLLVSPMSREVIYAGKMLGSLLFMLVIEIIALPVFAGLFTLPLLSTKIVAIVFLTTIGFVAIGTVFSAVAINTKAREMVLPVLFLPIIIPLLIAAIRASDLSLGGASWGALSPWLPMIVAYDAIFLVVAYLVFAFVVEE